MKSNRNYWYIGIFPSRNNTGIISTQDSPLSRLYKSNWNPNELRSKLIPPENGWAADAREVRTQALPTCHLITNNESVTRPDTLVVEGCGMPEINGTYKLTCTTFKSGLPIYKKRGQMNNKPVEFIVCSQFKMNRQVWDIGVNGEDRSFFYTICSRRRGDRLDKAPLNGSTWHLTKEGGGVHPPPQVKRG